MKKYLIDTTILIAHLRGFAPATTFLMQEEGVIISYVTLAELMQGTRNTGEIENIKRLVEPFTVHWGSETVNKRALELVEHYHLSHTAHVLDMLIAATALTANLPLITDNVKDFQFIPDLTVQKPPYEQVEKAA
jgi:tRNA(fMet)-specific endonuclease VapC